MSGIVAMIYRTSPRVQLSQPRFQVLSLASRKAQEREPSERGCGFALSLYHSLFLYDVFIYHLSLLIRGQQKL